MQYRFLAALLVGLAAAGCRPSAEGPPAATADSIPSVASADSAHAKHATRDADSAGAHVQHDLSGGAVVDAHAEHGTAAVAGDTRDPHTGHGDAGPAAASRGQHAAHLPLRAGAEPEQAIHATHAMPRDTTRGAQAHDGTQSDSTHARHVARRDTAQAAHAQHAMPRDSGSAQHASVDTMRHGMHQPPSTDTSHTAHGAQLLPADGAHAPQHADPMWMRSLGGGWHVAGMAQVLPIYTWTEGGSSRFGPLDGPEPFPERREAYLTQPAAMFNVESRGARVALRATLNFEGLTQPDGEYTWGGWGEGFIDKRHPHTLLHEAMLSFNFWDFAGGAASLSLGKGFAPYGTDDPMSRPPIKYPTNHHLSQILERWTLNGVYLRGDWSIEAGVFGGAEPENPYDFSNLESFADSWSARVARRFGAGGGPFPETELSVSYGNVREVHHGHAERTSLYNAALRHEHTHGFGKMYYLVEGSLSEPEGGNGYYSVLGEGQLALGRHMPYGRIEYAIRPEFPREDMQGTEDFYRYDHDEDAIGATRWRILTLGYDFRASTYPVGVRPTIALQHHRVWEERGGIRPETFFGQSSFWSVTAGFKMFFGGSPMRMGAYGVLDPMTVMHRSGGHDGASTAPPAAHPRH